MMCEYCGEPISESERNEQPDYHRECAFRTIAGSVAHIERRCGCYVRGSVENDDPGLTKREAAQAALAAWARREARVQ